MRNSRFFTVALTMLGLAVAGCDATDPDRQSVSVSFSSQPPAAAVLAPDVALDVTVTEGTNTLVITKAEVVIRRIKLKQALSATCTDDDDDSPDCENLTAGPVLVSLPLTGSTVTSIAATVPTGTFREIEFRVHKPGDDDPAEIAFTAANPAFADISIRVEGTYNGTAFLFTSDLNEKREIEFTTPIVIDADDQNVTISFDVATWFRNGTTVINPATANKGQPNENLVKTNIRASIRAFGDDDRNGR